MSAEAEVDVVVAKSAKKLAIKGQPSITTSPERFPRSLSSPWAILPS